MSVDGLPKITEREFLGQVVQLARLKGWKVAHFRPGMNRRGKWSTAVQGDGSGFPDLLLVRRKGTSARVLAAELKVGKNRLTEDQDAWLTALSAAGVTAMVWFPEDWEMIQRILE